MSGSRTQFCLRTKNNRGNWVFGNGKAKHNPFVLNLEIGLLLILILYAIVYSSYCNMNLCTAFGNLWFRKSYCKPR